MGATNLRQTNERCAEKAADINYRIRPVIEEFVRQGLTRRQTVEKLIALGLRTPRSAGWSLVRMERLLGALRE